MANTWESGYNWDESGKEGDFTIQWAQGVSSISALQMDREYTGSSVCACMCMRVCVERVHKHVSKCDKLLTAESK